MDNSLTPEAVEVLGQVYAFLLRRRRERLARQAQQTADAGNPGRGSASAVAQAPETGPTAEIVTPISALSTEIREVEHA